MRLKIYLVDLVVDNLLGVYLHEARWENPKGFVDYHVEILHLVKNFVRGRLLTFGKNKQEKRFDGCSSSVILSIRY